MKKKALTAFLMAIVMGMSIQLPAVGITTTCLAAELDDGCDGVPVEESKPSVSAKPGESDGNDGDSPVVGGNSISAPTSTSYQITASSLRVRSGAGTSYERLGALAKGDRVEVLEIKNDWGRIRFNGKEGWISLAYCQKMNEAVTKKQNYRITASTLNVRSGAGTGYSKIGSLLKGTIAVVSETKNGWGKITYKGMAGWISMQYCKSTDDAVSPMVNDSYRVTATSLNVRLNPGTGNSCIGSLTKGIDVKVLEVREGWGRISYKNKTGWIALRYCSRPSY